MGIRFADWLFVYLQRKDPNFIMTETPGGVKIVEWVYTDDKMFVGFFSYENELIDWYIDE